MKEINLSSGNVAIIDDEDFEILSRFKWYVSTNGYAVRKLRGKVTRMHRIIMGIDAADPRIVDHINRNKLDNRRENLRMCCKSENGMNQPMQSNNTSGFKGVTWHKRCKRWQAAIRFYGKQKYLGMFKTPEEAAAAYKKAASELHGEFSRTS